jgi:uncharacterized repeat protein (TIGR01451 family)
MAFLNDVLYSASNHAGVWRRTGLLSNVSGNVYRDVNNNGAKDAEDYNLEGFIVSTSPNLFSAASNENGNFIMITDAIDDTLHANLQSPNWQSNPPYYLITGEATNQNFGIHIPDGVADLNIDFTNDNVFRPGFATNFTITVNNVGSIVQSPVVRVVLDEHLTLVSSTPAISSQNQDTLIWNLNPLDFWQSSQITIQTIADQATPIGTEAYCYSSVAPIQNDVTTEDNVSTVVSDYVGSYDPNDKTCLQGDFFTPEQLENNEELEFVIRFQNTGTFQADNILVSDTLSSFLDISTLRLISYSHPVQMEVSGNNIVDFHFNNIFLPDSFANEPLSHGFVKFAVHCRPEIILGDAITNTGFIYFDFNEPIITNTTTTIHGYPVILGQENQLGTIHPQSILVFPNPAQESLNIDTRGIEKEKLFISLFDSKGARVRNQPCVNEIENIGLGGLSKGIYFGMIYNEKGQRVGQFKFIRE